MPENRAKDESEIKSSVNMTEPDQLLGLTDDVVIEFQQAIEYGLVEHVRELALAMHTADTADLIELLSPKNRGLFLEMMDGHLDPEVYSVLDEAVRDELVEDMEPTEIAAVVRVLDTDDAVYVLEDMEEDEQREILEKIPVQERTVLEEGLAFAEDTAGRLMQRDLIAVPELWTIGQTIDFLRDNDDLPEEFYEIFVVDPRHHPIGTLALNKVMRNKRDVLVADVMEKEQTLIPIHLDQEEVAYIFKQYRLTSAAAVDEQGRLIGVITVDDIVDVIHEEAEEDMLRLGGVAEDDLFDTVIATSRTRFSWLLVNLLTAILASIAIGFFGATMEKIIALAILMPIVASMGGNAGTQTLTVAVRALATKELTATNMMRILSKETLVSVINGSVFAVLMGIVAWVWFESVAIGAIISIAMIFNLLIAGVAGILVPVTLDRLNIDPAVASGVFVTTITDLVGFIAFLGLATLVLT